MANPISYEPAFATPAINLQDSFRSSISNEPVDHPKARIAGYEVLDEARRQGFLDILHGLMGAKDTIIQELADHTSTPQSIAAIRNLFILTRALGQLEPESLCKLTANMSASMTDGDEGPPPTLWGLVKRLNQQEVRRGLAVLLRIAGALGRSKQ